jgi:hypothetical protein
VTIVSVLAGGISARYLPASRASPTPSRSSLDVCPFVALLGGLMLLAGGAAAARNSPSRTARHRRIEGYRYSFSLAWVTSSSGWP